MLENGRMYGNKSFLKTGYDLYSCLIQGIEGGVGELVHGVDGVEPAAGPAAGHPILAAGSLRTSIEQRSEVSHDLLSGLKGERS
jgi:hypothetical protein